jgi:hypothetical protein
MDIYIYNFFVGKPDGKRPLRTPVGRSEDNIRMDFREIVGKGVDWMHLAQGRTNGGL